MSILKKFDELMSHLNSEENGMAEDFRSELADHINEARRNEQWIAALDAVGVDNWDGYEDAQNLLPDDEDEDD